MCSQIETQISVLDPGITFNKNRTTNKYMTNNDTWHPAHLAADEETSFTNADEDTS